MPRSKAPSSTSSARVINLCVVCGANAEFKCTECAKHGFDLYFCGIAHRKLIYFSHKRTCGINANPFRFPGLSPFEFNFLTSRLPDENSESYNPNPEKYSCGCEGHGSDSTSVSKQNVATKWDYLREPSGSSKGSGKAWDPYHLYRLLLVRRQTFRKSDDDDSSIWKIFLNFGPDELRDHFFDLLANRLYRIVPEIVSPKELPPFYTPFHHKYLIYLSLMVIHHSPTYCTQHIDPNVEKYLQYARKELEQFCRKVVAKTHPQEAALILKDIADGKD